MRHKIILVNKVTKAKHYLSLVTKTKGLLQVDAEATLHLLQPYSTLISVVFFINAKVFLR